MSAPTVRCSPEALHALPTRELETELLTLAGHVAAAQCRFLLLLAEFEHRDGWAGPGLRSFAHWLSWRTGMSLRTAGEHVRVARALTQLPAVTAAFATGTISYSKVRAITRLVGDTPREPDQADSSGDDAVTEPPPELADDAEEALLNIALNGTASHVESVVRATRRRLTDPARLAALRGISWRWDDDGSLVVRGRFTPDDGVALISAIEALVPARPPASHDDPPQPEGWEQGAAEQEPGAVVDRIGARRADALVRLVTQPADQRGTATATGSQVNVILHLEAGAEPQAELLAGPEIPQSTAERLACDAHVQALLEDTTSNRLYLGRRHRLATPAQIAALTVRDGRQCQFPGCANSRFLHAHHIRHWLHGGRTDIDNLILVCTFHHMLIHDNGFEISRSEGTWQFRRPDGSEVPVAPTPLSGRTERLIESHTRAQLEITRDSLTPDWGGERLDLGIALDRMLPRPSRMAA